MPATEPLASGHGCDDLTLEEAQQLLADPRLPEVMLRHVEFLCEPRGERLAVVADAIRQVHRQAPSVWVEYGIGDDGDRLYRLGKYAEKLSDDGICFDDEPFGGALCDAFSDLHTPSAGG
ncbi:MAG: hypothetical protein KC621_32015 [Myxococcales bacterium]|nr:hypothetical protein [Myxococcales bacterium]